MSGWYKNPKPGVLVHGMSDSSEYKVWQGMIRRCYETKHMNFKYYGVRGITVCDRWRNSFASFYEDVGPRPSQKHEIERIDNNGNYTPGNVRWATHREQCINTRRNRFIELNGERLCVTDWAKKAGIAPSALRWRLRKGWSIGDALSIKTTKGANQWFPVINRL
jgi:hypothetical protein